MVLERPGVLSKEQPQGALPYSEEEIAEKNNAAKGAKLVFIPEKNTPPRSPSQTSQAGEKKRKRKTERSGTTYSILRGRTLLTTYA